MPKEILSTNGQPTLDSPLGIEQDRFFVSNIKFPQSREEFAKYLTQIPKEQREKEKRLFEADLVQAFNEWWTFPWLSLRWHGKRIESGKSTVAITTGFGMWPQLYTGLELWLKNTGYQPVVYAPNFFNVEPIDQMIEDYFAFLKNLKKNNGKFDLIGHSKGGLLNFATSVIYPEEFCQIANNEIYLGAPIPNWVNSTTGEMYLFWLNFFGGDDFKLTKLLESVKNPKLLMGRKVSSIGLSNDPIIQGEFIGTPYLVFGSHTGLPWNRQALRQISLILDPPQVLAA